MIKNNENLEYKTSVGRSVIELASIYNTWIGWPETFIYAAQSHSIVNFNKGDFIYQENDRDKKVYLIKEGKVKIGHNTEDGKEISKAILVKGDMFGEMVLMGEHERIDFAQAETNDTVLCLLTVEQMEDLMKRNQPFNLKVRKLIGSRLKRAESMISSLLFKTSRTRIIDYLLHLADEKGKKVGFETLIQDFHSHKIIGNLTATSRQTVTTVLNELRAKNFIYFNRKSLLIRDIKLLEGELS